MRIHTLVLAGLGAAVPFSLSFKVSEPAQDRPIAIVNARILMTAKGATIEKGVVIVRDGKIEAAGADVKPPRNAEIVDAAGGTVMPGLVNANSRLGLVSAPRGPTIDPGGRRGGRRGPQIPGMAGPSASAVKTPRSKVLDSLEPGQEVFEQVLKAGVTTVALKPAGQGFPGQGGIIRPSGATLEEMKIDDSAFLLLGVAANTATKEMLKGTFTAAKKEIERRKSAPASRPGAESRPAGAEAPTSAPATRPAPETRIGPAGGARPSGPQGQAPGGGPAAQGQPRPDPDLDPLIEAVEGKLAVFVNADSANEAAHFFHAMKEHALPFVFLSGTANPAGLHVLAEELGKAKAKAVIPATLTALPNTQVKVNPAAILAASGVEVSFGIGSSENEARKIFFDLMELVRAGLTPAAAIEGVTLRPARALGVDARVGSVEAGKDANLILFSGDPLEPTSRLLTVWLEGKKVHDARPGVEPQRRTD